MKTITIDISDKVYDIFTNFLKLLPKDSFKVYIDDIDELTNEESDEVSRLQKMTNKGDYKEFNQWNDIEKSL